MDAGTFLKLQQVGATLELQGFSVWEPLLLWSTGFTYRLRQLWLPGSRAPAY